MPQHPNKPRVSFDLFHGESFPEMALLDKVKNLKSRLVASPEDLAGENGGILLLDRRLLNRAPLSKWRAGCPEGLLIVAEDGSRGADYLTPRGWPPSITLKTLENACRELGHLRTGAILKMELENEHEKLLKLTEIGLALSAEMDLNRLLTMILKEGRNWGCCDAASLFLIDRKDKEKPQVVFKLAQNDSVSCPFLEERFPLDTRSIAGFVAVTGEILNISDVYLISPDEPYLFNSSFDESIGYRTRSMITIPMKNYNQEVIGVLQFINRKTSPKIKLTSREITENETLPFSEELAVLLQALASQAAVAYENTILITQIQELFEGFVNASVKAIEQRDEPMRGHSFRVAAYTTGLAHALRRSDRPRFRDIHFSDTQIREIRYASLLHDFGKVGVREHVLVKANKLPDRGFELVRHRFLLYMEQLRRKNMEERLRYLQTHGRDAYRRMEPEFDDSIRRDLARYTRFLRDIETANKPSILPEDAFSHLLEIRDEPPFYVDDEEIKLLNDNEFLALSIKRGSLTQKEREEIESHVVHTYEFLKEIPWTQELSRIPEFAGAHHEKLDGSGYPDGKTESRIPLPSKMMTISDIFDALTASDRPYKKSLNWRDALEILESEADRKHLDKDLVAIFIEAEIYKLKTAESERTAHAYEGYGTHYFQRNVCTYNLTEKT